MENVQNHKHEQPCSPWHIHCFTLTTILLCFWGEYHRRCTKNNKRIDFHKRNDCRSSCRFFCSLWPLQDINGQVWMSYIPITQSTGLKNYPPKKQKLEVFLPGSWQPAKWPAIAPGQLTHLCMGLVNHYCCQTCKSQLWPAFKSPRALEWATMNK